MLARSRLVVTWFITITSTVTSSVVVTPVVLRRATELLRTMSSSLSPWADSDFWMLLLRVLQLPWRRDILFGATRAAELIRQSEREGGTQRLGPPGRGGGAGVLHPWLSRR